jgi:lambda family phage tail tape measure protein
MSIIGSLSVKLGLVTADFDTAAEKAKRSVKDLGKSMEGLGENVQTLYGHWKTLGGALGVGSIGMAALIEQTLEFSNEIKDLSKGFDISVAKILQFRDALKTSGGNAEGASKMLSTLFSKLSDARQGNEVAIAQFERLGISFDELINLKPDEAVGRIFQALNRESLSTYDKIKLVKEMLGKQGIGVAVDEMAEKLNMSVAAYKKQEQSIEKLGEVSDNLKTSMDNLKLAFAEIMSPFTREGIVSIEKFKAILYGIGAAFIVGNILSLVQVIIQLNKALKETAVIVATLEVMSGAGVLAALAGAATYLIAKSKFEGEAAEAGRSVSGPLIRRDGSNAQQTGPRENLDANRREIIAAQAKLDLTKQSIKFAQEDGRIKLESLDTDKFAIQLKEVNLNLAKEIATAQNARAQALNKENLSEAQKGFIQQEYLKSLDLAHAKANAQATFIVAQREKQIMQTKLQMQFDEQSNKFDQEKLRLAQQQYYMRDNEVRLANEMLDTQRKIADIEKQIIEAKISLGAGKTFDAEETRLKKQIQLEIELSQTRQQTIALEEQRRTSFSEGWNQAFRQYAYDAENYSRMGADAFTSVTGNMNAALDNFVRTGKLNFKDLARSIIQDLIAISLKAQAMSLFKMSGLGSLFGGGGQKMTTSAFEFGIDKSGMYADGGDPPVGQVSLVGERGPELFIPKQAGTIIPNNTLQGMMGNNQPSVTYNGPYIAQMSAIDTQSATQFLSRNKSAVWAANQTAQRALPQSR